MAGEGGAWLGRRQHGWGGGRMAGEGQHGMARERAGKYHGHQFRTQSEFSQGSWLAAFLIKVGPQSRIRSHSHRLSLCSHSNPDVHLLLVSILGGTSLNKI